MATKPTTLPRWANVGGAIVTPASAKLDIGWVAGERPPAQYDNWHKNLVYQWVQYLSDGNFSGATTFDSTIKVGTASSAVTISRFTGEAISTMTDADRQATVPTGSAVKAYADGVATGRLLGVQVLTGSATASPASGTKRVRLRMIGGGGGGGGAKLSGVAGSSAAGAGGTSGVLLEIWISAGAPVTYGTFSCGAGGTGGITTSDPAGDGGDGGDTTILINGTLYTTKGGGGGRGMTGSTVGSFKVLPKPPAAGTSSGGQTTYGVGGIGQVTPALPVGGNGGSTSFGAGGQPGGAGVGNGSGGGGGDTTSSTAQVGGAGAPGCIVLEEYA